MRVRTHLHSAKPLDLQRRANPMESKSPFACRWEEIGQIRSFYRSRSSVESSRVVLSESLVLLKSFVRSVPPSRSFCRSRLFGRSRCRSHSGCRFAGLIVARTLQRRGKLLEVSWKLLGADLYIYICSRYTYMYVYIFDVICCLGLFSCFWMVVGVFCNILSF